ncbi:1581_t:CDS:2 [Scutellospora calospora]|uniref:1581_t:CDS:1 n=1 Tax=Scutellospora calospora TaxID=85575 RepID=A0ACA9N5W8_9GLOM|nr:1581_t:CDS:2 [Scutellospora calospora]
MSLSIVFPGIDKTFDQFVEELLQDNFNTYLTTNTESFKFTKEKVFKYFVYEFLSKNGIDVEMNMKSISFIKNIFLPVFDGNIDIHGQYRILNYFCQCKYKNINHKIQLKEMREFLNLVEKKIHQFGFLVSNVELSDDALKELNASSVKDRACVCYDYEIVERIKEYAVFIDYKNQKKELDEKEFKIKYIKLEKENEMLKIFNDKYEKHIEKFEKFTEFIEKYILKDNVDIEN